MTPSAASLHAAFMREMAKPAPEVVQDAAEVAAVKAQTAAIERVGQLVVDAMKADESAGEVDALGSIAAAILKAAAAISEARQPITVQASLPPLPAFPAFPAIPAPIVNVTNEAAKGGEWEIRLSSPNGEQVMRVKRLA